MHARARRGRRIVLRPRLLGESRQRPPEPRDEERWRPGPDPRHLCSTRSDGARPAQVPVSGIGFDERAIE